MGKNMFVMGDSYSTYAGYIPEGYAPYYGDTMPKGWEIESVDDTWWRQVAKKQGYNILLNDSWSGSTVCNSLRPTDPKEYTFVRRIDKYISEGFFEKNEVDTFFIFGLTNDSWRNCPIGETKYDEKTEKDLDYALAAYCYLVERIKSQKNIKRIVAIINDELKPEITDGTIALCKHYEIEYVMLHDLAKVQGHPNKLGMAQIAEQICEILNGEVYN